MDKGWWGELDRKTEEAVRMGMAKAGIRTVKELAELSGIAYRTLLRRIENGSEFTIGELHLLKAVIPLEGVPL